MTHAKELDLGPLTWVKSEIELALTRAAERLDQAIRASDSAARVQFAQTHLHQVRGALSIVGLDGLTQFATVVDQLFGAMTRGEIPVDEGGIELGKRALATIGNYLEELAHGTPDQPLRLQPIYHEVVIARGHDAPSAADLFFPDMGVRMPRPQSEALALPAELRQERIRALRTRFQRGLLDWLKLPAGMAGPDTMHAALVELESLEVSPPSRAMWWVAQAFVDTLTQTPSDKRAEAKGLLSRIDAQLRRTSEAPSAAPERLMREMLYQVACAPASTDTQGAVRKTWQLDALLPEPGARVSDVPLAPLLQDLRSRLASIKEQWDAFSTGAAIALPRFESQLDHFAAPVSRLGRPSVDRLIRGIQQFTQWLRKDPLHFSDSISIELATALLLTEAALDRSVPDASFSAQVDDTLSRLEALARGERLAAAENSPGLETARRAQERDALSQLSREILTSLANVEQTLDDFFRDQLKRAPLAQLSTPLRQIEGALSLLGEADAISLIHEVGEAIARFAAQDTPAEQTELEALASRLSALGFFIQSLQHGRTSLQQFLNPDAPAQTDELEPALDETGTAADYTRTEPAVSDTHDFMAASADEPPAQNIKSETNLEAASPNELSATASDEEDTAEAAAMPEVGAETRRLIEASDEEIDAELLCIFIEEAHEVLATIGEQVELSRTDPANVEYLTAIRRGFHTLKGSGRMVGLRDLGEAAWGLEQTLNRWLQLEWPPTSALHHLIDESHQHFSAWVVQLETGGSQHRDVTALLAEASRLCESDSPTRESAVSNRAGTPHVASGSNSGGAVAEADFIETTLEFPDLTLSESGEVLPFMAEAEASTFLPEETSLEEFPIFGEDFSFELTDTEAIDVGPPQLPQGSTPETEAPRIAIEPDTQAESETIDLEPLLGPIDLDLSDDESYEAFAPPTAASVDTEQPPELLNITALDDAWLPVEETFDLVDEEIAPDETIEAIEAAIDGMEAGIDEVDAIELAREEPAEALPAEEVAAAHDASILHETPASTSLLNTDDASALSDSETAALAEDIEALELPDAEETVEVEGVKETQETSEATEVPEVEDAPALAEAIESSGTDFIRVGDAEISRPLYDLYLAEAKHHIATLQQDFSRLAANPTLPPPETALRAAHTFGGISGTARIASLQMLARALEHAEQRLRDQGAPPSADNLNLFRTVVIALEGMLAEVVVQRMPLDAPELIAQLEQVGRRASEPIQAAEHTAPTVHVPAAAEEPPVLRVHDEIDDQLLPIFLEEAGELLSDLHTTLRNWQADPRDADHAKSVARLLHTLKGSARMAGAMTLGEQVHQLESRLELATGSGQDLSVEIEDLVAGLDLTEQMIDALAGGELPAPAVLAGEAAVPHEGSPTSSTAVTIDASGPEGDSATGSGTLRVRAELVDRFVNEAGEIGVARTRIDGELRNLRRSMLDLTENVIRLRNQLREVEIQADVQMQSRIAQAESHHAEFDPLEMDRYTRLQELTRMMAESVNDVTTVQQSLLKNLDGADLALHSQARMSRELQQALMRVRMVPFDSLADRLYRIVRKSGKELGKRANLDLRGGRIEVDRSMLEHMVAPLEHLLRNALAHGIEPPEVRRAANKPEIGQITLTVRQEGNEIAIELADDGAGLDFERIAARARANGLLGPDEPADESRLINLIFVPGFSTAGQLSAVSGRGVGMDVVKAETAAVGGRIDVSSTPEAGTVFRIYLPLTLAVTQALLVRAGGRHYAIPSSMVALVMELKADPLERLQIDGGTDWQGQHYAYRYLPRLLGDPSSQPEVQRYNWVLLLRAGAQTLALHVDAMRGNQEIIVKNAGPQLTRIVGMSGATVLGDGEIVLILNPVALASRGLAGSESGAARDTPTAPAAAHVPTVMVVDDSLTVRKIIGRLLEREGYRVITAKDGVDALEALIETVPDVILSDIEMPRMDGFDLVRNIRADLRTRQVPVIMITSRLADKHRSYAMEIGANHYLGKPYQEEELLGLIAGYIRPN